jgi:hypothetical protein
MLSRIVSGRVGRWVLVGAGLGAAVLLGAGPAAAVDGGVWVDGGAVSTDAGQLVVSGAYSCDPGYAPYAQLTLTVTEPQADGSQVEAVVNDRVPCTGYTQGWQETLTARHASQSFTPGSASVYTALWFPGNWADRSETQQWVSVS